MTDDEKLQAKTADFVGRIHRQVAKAKSDWLAMQMKRILPDEIYAKALVNKGRMRGVVQQYMAQNRIRLEEHPSETRLMRGDEIVSRFRFRHADGKWEIQVDQKPTLEQPSNN